MLTRSIYFKECCSDTFLLVESCYFNANIFDSTDDGGNIYYNGFGGCVQNKVCSSNCTSNGGGIHSYMNVNRLYSDKNWLIFCSFSQLKTSQHGSSPFRNWCVYQEVNKVNITYCIVYEAACFSAIKPGKKANITNTNCQNNTSFGRGGIMLESGGEFEISRSNIIKQNTASGKGVIYVFGSALINFCVIKENIAQDNILLYASTGQGFRVYNSYINNPLSTRNAGGMPVFINASSNEDEIRLELFSTANCKINTHHRVVLEYNNYNSFAEVFCETFVNNYLSGLVYIPTIISCMVLFLPS